MLATVSKWENSLGIRIPSIILSALNIREGDKLTCDLDADKIILKKAVSTTEMFESFYQKPFSEITVSDLGDGGEIDWGDDVGGECL